MASRELKVEIIGDASSLEKAFGRADKATGKLGGSSTKASKALGFLKGGLIGVGAAAAGALAVGFKRGFDEMVEAQKVTAQTEAVLKSTGGQAGLTAKQVENLAGRLSAMSGVDDEAIQSGENLLLTFTNVRNEVGKGNDIFSQATGIMLDMSTALGQDMKSSAIQLGKALNDPIKGMSALQRVGVSFTAAQKETVKGLVESGKSMDAQKLILRELTKEFGGSAKAAGDTFPGQMNKLKNAFDEVAAKMVEKLLPYMTRFADFLLENMPTIERVAGEAFKKIGDALTLMGEAFETVRPVVEQLLPVMLAFSKFLLDVMLAPLQIIVSLLKGDWSAAWDAAKQPVLDLVAVLGSVYTAVISPLIGQFTELAGWVGEKIGDIVGFFTGLPGRIAGTFADLAATALGPFKSAFTTAKNWVGDRIDDVVGFFTGLPARIFATVAGLISTAITPFQNAFGSIKSFVGGVIDDVVGFFTKLPGRIASTIGSLISTGLQPFQSAFSTMSDAVTGMLGKIRDGIEWIGNKAGGVLNLAVAPFRAAGRFLADALGPLVSILNTILNLIKDILALWDSLPFVGGGGGEKQAPGVGAGGVPAAKGGPVRKGQLYLVGEEGPEMFIPKASGTIATARQTRDMLRNWVRPRDEQNWRDLLATARGAGGIPGVGDIKFGDVEEAVRGFELGYRPPWADAEIWDSSNRLAQNIGKLDEFLQAVAGGSFASNAGLLEGLKMNRTRWNWNDAVFTPRIRRMLEMMYGGMTGREVADYFNLMAKGGIVTRPTLAMIGEAGPEAVVPLNRYGRGAKTEIHFHGGTWVGGNPDALARDIEQALAQRKSSTRRALAFE